MMQNFSVPGVGRLVNAAGTFVRYESAAAAAVVALVDLSIRVRADRNDLGLLLPGDSIELPLQAVEWEFTPASVTNDGALVRVGVGRVISSRMTISGSVAIATPPQSASFANTSATVTTTSAQLVAANALRESLLVQNKSATGTIWLVVGATATQALGVRLLPGDAFYFDGTQSTQAVHAIGDIASNPDVTILQG